MASNVRPGAHYDDVDSSKFTSKKRLLDIFLVPEGHVKAIICIARVHYQPLTTQICSVMLSGAL